MIRQILEGIESAVRYRYVKYLKAYNDVLTVVLLERGEADSSAPLVPLHLYLECGTSDAVAINLISLGMSRTTALLLIRQVSLPSGATPEDCLSVLGRVDIAA